ncbi:MAG: YbaN family protein [Pseudomonadota bacterium]
MTRALWMMGGFIALGLGLLGVVLPLLPTVPLVLLAAFCFARSSERMHQWLVEHPRFGPGIRNWQEHGAISVRGKRMAAISIGLVFTLSVLLSVPAHILLVQAVALGGSLLFVLTRPSGPASP